MNTVLKWASLVVATGIAIVFLFLFSKSIENGRYHYIPRDNGYEMVDMRTGVICGYIYNKDAHEMRKWFKSEPVNRTLSLYPCNVLEHKQPPTK